MRIAFLIAASLLAACTVANDGSMGQSAGKFVPANDDQVNKAKKLVVSQLLDPDSARFGAITTDGKIICGTINAKNTFGGYAGSKVFAIDGPDVHMQGSSPAWSFYGCPGSWSL